MATDARQCSLPWSPPTSSADRSDRTKSEKASDAASNATIPTPPQAVEGLAIQIDGAAAADPSAVAARSQTRNRAARSLGNT